MKRLLQPTVRVQAFKLTEPLSDGLAALPGEYKGIFVVRPRFDIPAKRSWL